MSVADKIAALFNALTREDVEAMPPAQRRRFADTCRHWAKLADLHVPQPKSGVLAELRHGVQND